MQDWLMRNPKSDRSLDRVQVVIFDVDGVFTDGKTWQDQSGQWRRTFSVRDTMGVRALRRAGYRVAVLTPALSSEIKLHFEHVGLDAFKDHCLEPRIAIDHILRSYGFSMEHAAFVREAPSGAVELRLQESAIYTSARQGGDGAVSEICNLILQHAGSLATQSSSSSIRTKVGEL
jgi:3-deoxy-D-manno-octulosonate 8-phosphate phosphatase (KDO 8-P phosphatase)